MRPHVIAEAIVRTVKAATAPIVAELAQLHARLERLEHVPPLAGPPGEPGAPGARGAEGAAGAPGLGFEDLAVEFDGRRTLTFAFVRGTERKAWPIVLPIPINRGTFVQGKAYEIGDEITHHGSLWRCEAPADEAPPGHGWRLIVKKGRPREQGGIP